MSQMLYLFIYICYPLYVNTAVRQYSYELRELSRGSDGELDLTYDKFCLDELLIFIPHMCNCRKLSRWSIWAH